MLKHVYLLFIATFLFGFLVGAVVFFMNNTGGEGDGGIDDEASRGMVVSAKAYGGCAKIGCPSFRIENNGSYIYISGNFDGEEMRFEDTLSSLQLSTLREELSNTDFEKLDDTEFTGTCPVTYDGLAYEYSIEYKGERYEVDSCIEVLEGEPFFETLEGYFNVFNILHARE